MKNINKIIEVKYGYEYNEFINKEKENYEKNNIEKKYTKNDILNDIIKQLNITNYIIDNNNIIWFNAKNIINFLEYKDSRKCLKKYVDVNDKSQLGKINFSNNIKQHTQTLFINSHGLYNLLLKSKMEKAQNISKIITSSLVKK
jgi:prophage antirepressor-like protein